MIKRPLFGVYLGREQDNTGDLGSLYIGVDSSKFVNDLDYNPVVGSGSRWMITLNGLYIEGTSYESGRRKAIIDTGTSTVVIPYEELLKIKTLIPGTIIKDMGNLYFLYIPCDATQPPLIFSFGDVSYRTNPMDFIDLSTRENDRCRFNIIGGLESVFVDEAWIIGIPFLKNVNTIFEIQKQGYRIGFSPVI